MVKKFSYISNSIKGIQRDSNQDRIMVIEEPLFAIFIAFDGVSSYPLSFKFIEKFKEILHSKIESLNNHGSNISDVLFESHEEALALNIDGMSTLSLLRLDYSLKTADYINIGDSRIYSITNRYINSLTVDDSLYNGSNILSKCLGMDTLTAEDFSKNGIDFFDKFLLCTDGFYSLLENHKKEYFETFNLKYARNIEKRISALQEGVNNDDSTYILIKNEVSI